MKYFSLGDEDTVLGFSLVGVEGQVVQSQEEAISAFQKVIIRKDIGILLITEKIAQLISTLIEKRIYTLQFPLIVEIPDRNGPLPGRKSVDEIIRSSIGIKI